MPAQAQKPSMVQVTLRSSFWLTNRELFWLKPWVIAFRSLHQVLYASQASDSALALLNFLGRAIRITS
jgi:hypothetical protein